VFVAVTTRIYALECHFWESERLVLYIVVPDMCMIGRRRGFAVFPPCYIVVFCCNVGLKQFCITRCFFLAAWVSDDFLELDGAAVGGGLLVSLAVVVEAPLLLLHVRRAAAVCVGCFFFSKP